ncbi:TrkH family potassium uptake protein [Yoonia sediminilitoris]|uniref:Trk system potassium uptake protein n=1 Tax=Yoonia sediminilitoris TaxID=1286148 RepID=A0A2T6KEM8_9RHOB|nr:TrkH family potassium uptake protein [Yoonia sediminilitoris]PUB13573.1 trk system potassium uptake protein TrkH [Yoonia sediminilitoris]RCW94743.1 trk system potassium uptake protein TrkH [Yoonia sediminilitoris]
MLDLRPVGYVIGLLVAALGLTMLAPLGADLLAGNGHWFVFFESAVITVLCGGLMALACANGVTEGLSLRQTFLLTSLVWLTLPIFGAIPFLLGATEASLTDAFFESMSGLTTTGASNFTKLEDLPDGLKLWRGILQWLGGIGIIVVAMVFLPELKVGGMQIFRSESFDTMGKILPRAGQIATQISVIYVALSCICAFVYSALGMTGFDAIVHAMTTIATGGMANSDQSFAAYGAGIHYAASLFMILAALPFVRYVQLLAGTAQPLWRDSQIRTFLVIILICVLLITSWIVGREGVVSERAFRQALFNVTSIITGTGYANADYMQWGTFPVAMFFFIGLIGGCAGSTACSVKVFRYQLVFAAIKSQIRQIHSPHGIFTPRYEGRPISEDVLNSVMAFLVAFILTLGGTSVLLGMTGLDFITSVSGAATALANIGPGLGIEIGPAGTYQYINDTAKWILAIAMFVGRLEIMVILTILSVRFWRD